jgi:hypothetical protein
MTIKYVEFQIDTYVYEFAHMLLTITVPDILQADAETRSEQVFCNMALHCA